MSAYNEVNGKYANENEHLLIDILRKEWGFDGIVVTDWGASNNHTEGVKCQSNVEMPNPGLDSARGLLEDLKLGKITEAEIDRAIEPIIEASIISAKMSRRILTRRLITDLRAGRQQRALCF